MTFFQVAVLAGLAGIFAMVATGVDRLTQIRETLIAIRNRIPPTG